MYARHAIGQQKNIKEMSREKRTLLFYFKLKTFQLNHVFISLLHRCRRRRARPISYKIIVFVTRFFFSFTVTSVLVLLDDTIKRHHVA